VRRQESGFVVVMQGGRWPGARDEEHSMRKFALFVAAMAVAAPLASAPAQAQRHHRDADFYDRGYDDGEGDGYYRGYDDGRQDGTVTEVVQCKRRKGKGAVVGALAGGLLGNLTSDRNKLANTAIGAAGGGLAGDLIGKRGRDYDC
jgi:hypothetical protein